MMAPLERRFGLKTHDDFILAIDVAWAMRGDGTWNLRNVEHAFLSLFHKEFVQPIPQVLGPLGCGRKKRPVSLVWLVVLLDEVANIDLLLPETGLESLPWRKSLL